MGTLNTKKSDIGNTIILEDGCNENNYGYFDNEDGTFDFEEERFEIEAAEIADFITDEVEKIQDDYNTEFTCDTTEYNLKDIFTIEIEPGYYEGFSVKIDSIYSMTIMENDIKAGLEKIDIDTTGMDPEEARMKTYFRYIAEDIMPEWYDINGEWLSYSDVPQKELNKVQKSIEQDLERYFNYLNYKITEIGKEYGMHRLDVNWWVKETSPITDDMVNKLKDKYEKSCLPTKEKEQSNQVGAVKSSKLETRQPTEKGMER